MYEQIFMALADVGQIVAIVDITDAVYKHKDFLRMIHDLAHQQNQTFILVLNKIDQLKDKKELLALMAEYAALFTCDIVPISALTKDGIDILFEVLNKQALSSPFLFNPELLTDASEKEIVAELIREKAMLELLEELLY